jgi:hypothetical protein
MPYTGNKPSAVPLTSADIADSIITSAKIVDGTIVNADINASAAIVSTKLSGVTSGLTEADQWRLSTDLTGDQTITTNLERVDSDGSGYLGTGMTQSSGVFTFPSTGYYLVTAHFRFTSNATDNQQQGSIAVTINNSTYAIVTQATANFYSGSVLGTVSGFYLFDVTSTTTHKVRFEVSSINNQVTGSTTSNQTYFTFLKLGDT